MSRVAFIGLGNMGGRLARRLAATGHAVSGLDARPERAEQLGVEPPSTVAEACACEYVFLSLPSSREVEEVRRMFEGPGGILEPGRESLAAVDMTTAEAPSTRRLYQRALARGISLLDAPI
ncbi:MAG: NAD(P)-binding domain-containing protein [Actinomycetia bacterium]|nr:NAD(P)-binding domain-containing protein [Actinomycetes bacterium]